MEKILHTNGSQKKPGVAILKTDFKIKTVTNEEGHYIMIRNQSIERI